jgi:uncharacterized protein YecE (DUF72 family)
MRLRFGLAAWSNKHFDNALYPLGTKHAEHLPRYASVFQVAEADTLFHRLPDTATLQQWVGQTPTGFRFLPKMWKKVTHEGAGVEAARQWLTLLKPLRDAGKCGPILLQFPPQATRETTWSLVEHLLALEEPGTFALEVRHPSWFVEATQDLLASHDAPLVWSTHPKAFTPPWATAATGFVRFTGTYADQRGRFVTQGDRLGDVLEVRKRLAQAPWKDVYVIVTNPFEGNAVDSLPRIAAALGDEALAERVSRKPGDVLFPDPQGKGGRQTRL